MLGGLTGAAAAAVAPVDPFADCLTHLTANEERQVRASVQSRYRIAPADAEDLARDAMLKICLHHAAAPYASVGAAYQRAVDNAAKRNWARGRRSCDLPAEMPACIAGADDAVRFAQEERVAHAALCSEDELTVRVIRERVVEEKGFAEIGQAIGVSPDAAKDRFHNGLRRVQKRVRDACPAR